MKPNIAIVCGGDSKEIEVSFRSAEGLYGFIDKNRYNLFIVKIIGKEWTVEISDKKSACIDKNDFSFTHNGVKTVFDFAYITIHGTPGENGILQGYFELLRIPYSCCGVLAAALTFDKHACIEYLNSFDIISADSLAFTKNDEIDIDFVSQVIDFPCFVKPSTGGSSFGVSKVKSQKDMQTAIDKAFAESDKIMIEEFIQGKEFTCGMYRTREKTVVFPVSEVVPKNDFFDYDAKYNGAVEEITPARITKKLSKEIQEQTEEIYELLNCKGIIRIDYIVDKDNQINLLEVNTTPGMTQTSFIPQQVRAAGLNITDVLTEIIENELS
ncbi:MAG: D-alanine--D-alanine ligase [Paludibacter sp.]|nr:D-alanine--D-alanine ligase [Paludibacter sp.]